MFAREFRVVAAERITKSTLLLTLRGHSGDRLFTFQPGQYAAISFLRHGRPTMVRCFSIVSSPTEQGTLQFSMRIKGRFTTGAAALKPGDVVKVRGPFGGFVLDTNRDKDVVLLAGGIGITPFMSMIRYATTLHAPNPITLLYSCATQDDVPFADELAHHQHVNPFFTPVFVIGDGPTDKLAHHKVAKGRVTPDLLDSVTGGHYKTKTFFICGPPPFMKAMIAQLHAKGTPDSLIVTEAFSQGPNRQTGKIKSWPYNMYALSAVGVSLGSVVVMASDLLDTLPPANYLDSSSTLRASTLTSSRQQDLDSLVQSLPTLANPNPASDGAVQADQIAASNAAIQGQAAAAQPGTPSRSSSSATSSPAPSASTPAPAPVPVCTTTPSGVTTCK